jgi:Na+-translocating ferredoxin:NAD+ oxidoreductase RnfA subunit
MQPKTLLRIALFFEGYGIIMIFVLLLVSVCLWLIGDDIETRIAQRFLVVFACFLLVVAVTEFIYFFAMAASFTLLAGVCVILATVKQKTQRVWPAQKNMQG